MRTVLLVTKPLAPPWTDGAKNLARDLVVHAADTRFHCLVPPGAATFGGHAVLEPIYGAADHYAPGLRQNARVLGRLLKPDRIETYHFFFAPNPRTSAIARLVFALKRRHVVHSVVSRPVGRPSYFADVHIAVSEHTADRLRESGARGVVVVPPGIPDRLPAAPDRARFGIPSGVRAVLFAGDLTVGGGADLAAEAVLHTPDTLLVMACRPKGAGHRERQRELEARLGNRAVWLGEIDAMPTLLASVDVVALPATDLTGKVDLPLVLLEAMQAGTPVVVADAGPLRELGGLGQGVLRVAAEGGAIADAIQAASPRLGELARAHVAAAYSARGMAAAIERVYAEVTG